MTVNRKAGKNLCKEQDRFGHIIEGKNEERWPSHQISSAALQNDKGDGSKSITIYNVIYTD